MLLTPLEVENDFYNMIKAADIATKVNGGVYAGGQRPQNSTKEDIEVICTTLSATEVKEGIVTLLIYVPNVPQAASKGATVDNRPRLTTLARELTTWAEARDIAEGYYFKPKEAASIVPIPEIAQHAVSLRLTFRHYS